MDLGLKGRNAVVLGGTRGIGRAIAGTLAGEGAGVAVCARNADQVAATVAELKAMGVRATGLPVDITDAAALKSWITGAAKELGGIDMLFSNAGAMAQGGDPASWEQNFRLDVLGAVNARLKWRLPSPTCPNGIGSTSGAASSTHACIRRISSGSSATATVTSLLTM